MIKADPKSNAQPWELEISCANHSQMEAVVKILLKHYTIKFEVDIIETLPNYGIYDARYSVFMWDNWWGNLGDLIEKIKLLGIDISDNPSKYSQDMTTDMS